MSRGSRRFLLAAIGDEGVVLDAMTGELYRADAAAVVVFRALGRGEETDGAAAALVRAFAVSRARAQRDVRRIVATMGDVTRGSRRTSAQTSHCNPYELRASTRGGYDLFVDGRAAAWIDERGRSVERASAVDRRDGAILRLASPHALALARKRVLHASAVVAGGGIVAFVAPSGVGKTTLARKLEARGAAFVSEDLVLLADPRSAVVHGERAIGTWSRSRARQVSAAPLATAAAGRTRPLHAVVVIERAKDQERIVVERLRGADAIAALFANAFVEVPSVRVWREALAMCRALAVRGIVHRAIVPEGLALVDRALAAAESRRRSPRSSRPDDPVEALLGVAHAHPRVT